MIVLDTTVISELMRDPPNTRVSGWVDAQDPKSIWTTSVSVYEIRFGLGTMPAGARRDRLQQAFDTLLAQRLDRRVLPLDEQAAAVAAGLAAARQQAGRPIPPLDTLIAGIAISRGAAVATRNTRHFSDITTGVVDPWTAPRI